MKIITAAVNNPDFIEIQFYTLQKYFQGAEYEFIVFNDAKDFPDSITNGGDVTIKQQIEDRCKKLNVTCINIPNEHHKTQKDPSGRTANSMNYILEYQKQNIDKYLLLDSDMFLIDYFDINKYAEYACAIVLQSRYSAHYFWNGIYYFNMTKIKDMDLLNWNCCEHQPSYGCCGLDTGGNMHKWLNKQMLQLPMPSTDEIRWTDKIFHTENIYFIKHLWSTTWDVSELPPNLKERDALINFFKNDVRNTNGKFFCEIYDKVFLHYRAGGNWRNEGISFHKKLTQSLKDTLFITN